MRMVAISSLLKKIILSLCCFAAFIHFSISKKWLRQLVINCATAALGYVIYGILNQKTIGCR